MIQNIEVLKARFAELMTGEGRAYLSLTTGPIDDKAVEAAIAAFGDKEKRQKFFSLFKELEILYEIISPDVSLRPHIEDYGRLSVLYRIVRNAFGKQVPLAYDLMRKTESMVREAVSAYGLSATIPLVKIDENTVKALQSSNAPGSSKIVNLGRSLVAAVAEEENQQPYLIPIGERTEAILEMYDDRQITTQQALEKLRELLDEYVQAKRERERSGFDLHTFTIFWMLKQAGARDPDQAAPLVNTVFERFPNYPHNVAELRGLKAELYKVLLREVGKENMVAVAERLLKLERK